MVRNYLFAAALSVGLAACASLTPSQCASAKADFDAAHVALSNANSAIDTVAAALDKVKAATPHDTAAINRIEADLAKAQAALPILEAAVSATGAVVLAECPMPGAK